MAALQADGALYISWTPVGATVYKIFRNKLYEARLLEYLQYFAKQAVQKLPFKQGSNCQESTASSLTNDVKEMAKAVPIVASCSSVVDETAKLTTKHIVEKMSVVKLK